MVAAEKARLDAPELTPAARKSVTRTIRLLGQEADPVQAQTEAVIAANPELAEDLALVESVKGVGRQTATTVLAELPPVEHLRSAQSAGAYCGRLARRGVHRAAVRHRHRDPNWLY
jgi:transposase